MTEQEWMVSEDPQRMFRWVTRATLSGSDVANLERLRKRPSDRKLRLLACAISRLMVSDEETHKHIASIEQMADNLGADWHRPIGLPFQGAGYWCADPDIRHGLGELLRASSVQFNKSTLTHLLRDIVGNPHRPVYTVKEYLTNGVANATVKNLVHNKLADREFFDLSRKAKKSLYDQEIRRHLLFPEHVTPAVLAVAQGIYEEHRFEDMGILRDALLEAGCDNEQVLAHCLETVHVRGCHVLDLLLGHN